MSHTYWEKYSQHALGEETWYRKIHDPIMRFLRGPLEPPTEVYLDVIVVLKSKEKAMAVRTDLPDPNLPEEKWVSSLRNMAEPFNMRDYRDSANKEQKRVWMVEAARRISAGLHSKVLQVELTQIGSERINCMQMTQEAKDFWKNGFEQNMSEREILDGWLAMQSMMEDTVPKAE